MNTRLNCPMCGEPVLTSDDARETGAPDGMVLAHRECLLRAVVGGIGHLESHRFWCLCMHDPDGGRTYRQSAREVDEWVRTKGVPQ